MAMAHDELSAYQVYRSDFRHALSQVIGFGFTLFGAYTMWVLMNSPDSVPRWIIVVWAVLPPCYFFWEYRFWFDNWQNRDAVGHLRHFQALAGRIWLGILAVMLFVFKT